MKQQLLQNLKFILIGMLLVAGIGFAYADGWTTPTDTAPNANVDVPLHTGPTQVKNGGLGVGTFQVSQYAVFKQQTFLNGALEGGTPASTTVPPLAIGGSENNVTHTIPVTVAGGVSVTGIITNPPVASSAADGNNNLCANKNGVIQLCTTTGVGTGSSMISLEHVINPQTGNTDIAAIVNPIVTTNITVDIQAYDPEPLADRTDGCTIPTTPTDFGTLIIPALTNQSKQTLPYPANCAQEAEAIQYVIKDYSPTTDPATGYSITSS